MDLSNNRPHFHRTPSISNSTAGNNGSTSNQLFICFTSRLSSSSSIKISKSIFSPASRSLKTGQASPILSKKRGCGFENKEPTSPKVTCIGQVRVKTKKKAKHAPTLSEQGSGGYERWVNFPLTICDALKASSCFSTSEREKEENNGDDANAQRTCGGVFGRWFMTCKDWEGGKEREIELVGGDEDNVEMRSSRKHVLEDFKIDDGIFDGNGGGQEEGRVSICVPPKNALLLMRCRSEGLANRVYQGYPTQEEEEEEEIHEEGEVCDRKRSIFGEVVKETEGDVHKCEASKEVREEEEQEEGEVCNCVRRIFCEQVVEEIEGDVPECEAPEVVKEMVPEIENQDSIEVDEVLDSPMEVQDYKSLILGEAECDEGEEEEEDLKPETESKMSEILLKEEELIFMEALEYHIKITESEETDQIIEEEEHGYRISNTSFSSAINQVEEDGETEDVETESTSQKGCTFNIQPQLEYQTEDLGKTHENEEVKDQEMEISEPSIKRETESEDHFERRDQFMIDDNNENDEKVPYLVSTSPEAFALPDCLLLMMYEPKLSMEVSKETWVCSKDFTRWLSQRHQHVKQPPPRTMAKIDNTTNANSDEAKKMINTDGKSTEYKKIQSPHQTKHRAMTVAPPLDPLMKLVPPRSSCSFPVAAVSMASMIQHNLVNAVGYEPFALTRCKSEPMRTGGKSARWDCPPSVYVSFLRW